MIKDFYSLTKPGIIYGNLLTVIGGFFLASQGNPNIELLIIVLLGISFVIGCGCVLNNYIDRDIDSLMKRTQKRELVTGVISGKAALIFAVILGVMGLFLLSYTNKLTVIIAIVGLFVYVLLYSLIFKRRSIYGTLIGSISGAVPVLVGYCAVTHHIDAGAIILFFILAIWQMPHSYAIGISLFDDFSKASIQILPVNKGIYITKIHILFYTILFFIAVCTLWKFGYVGLPYLVILGALAALWIVFAILGFKTKNNRTWARKMFLYSIIIIVVFSITIALDWRVNPHFY